MLSGITTQCCVAPLHGAPAKTPEPKRLSLLDQAMKLWQPDRAASPEAAARWLPSPQQRSLSAPDERAPLRPKLGRARSASVGMGNQKRRAVRIFLGGRREAARVGVERQLYSLTGTERGSSCVPRDEHHREAARVFLGERREAALFLNEPPSSRHFRGSLTARPQPRRAQSLLASIEDDTTYHGHAVHAPREPKAIGREERRARV